MTKFFPSFLNSKGLELWYTSMEIDVGQFRTLQLLLCFLLNYTMMGYIVDILKSRHITAQKVENETKCTVNYLIKSVLIFDGISSSMFL